MSRLHQESGHVTVFDIGPASINHRVTCSRTDVAVIFLRHTVATSWSRVMTNSYTTRPEHRYVNN